MKLKLNRGTTSKLLRVDLWNSSGVPGQTPLSTLTSSTTGLKWTYLTEGATSVTTVSIVAGTLGTWTSGGFIPVDTVNMPGEYELGVPNAALASGGSVVMWLSGATALIPRRIEIELDAVNYQSTTNFVSSVPAVPGLTTATIATGVWQDATSSDFTVSNSVGKTLMSGPIASNITQVGGSAIPSGGSTVSGVLRVDVGYVNGSVNTSYDGTIASATSTTVTFPATDAGGNTIPDDNRYANITFMVVGGTGTGQIVVTNTKVSSPARTFNVVSGTMPVTLDSTSKYALMGSSQGAESGNVIVGGYAATQSPDYYILATPNSTSNRLATDTSGRILLQPTQAGVTIPTVTAVTGQLTAAQVATGVWQDTTSSDFTVTSSPGSQLMTGPIPANVTQFGGAAGTFASGIPSVNVSKIGGTTSAGAAGYVGIDWSHVTNATSTLNLSGTTISTSQTIATVTNQLTTAQIATAVWTDANGTDFSTSNSAGQRLMITAVPANVTQVGGVSIPSGGTTVPGVLRVDTGYVGGQTDLLYDGKIASATAVTVTFPTTDAFGNTIPDDNRYANIAFQVVGGTGVGQIVLTSSKNGARTFNVVSGTMPVQLDNTSQYLLFGPSQAAIAGNVTVGGYAASQSPDYYILATPNSSGNRLTTDTSGRVTLQPVQSGVTIPTVTTVTNQLTQSQIATAVWQDNNSSDFTVSSSAGKQLMTGPISANVTQWNSVNVATPSIAGCPVSTLSVGTGTGQVNVASGLVPVTLSSSNVTGNLPANLTTIVGAAITCAAPVTIGAYLGNANAALIVDVNGRVQLQSGSSPGQISLSSGLVQLAPVVHTGATIPTVTTTTTATSVTNPVLVSSGTGSGQISLTSGVVSANVASWGGTTVLAANIGGAPIVDAGYLLGHAISTPATNGILDVNVKNISGATVSTSIAQIGVNAVQIGSVTQTGHDVGAGVLLTPGSGSGQIELSSGTVTLASGVHTGAVIPTVTNVTDAVTLPVGSGTGQINLSSGGVLLQPTQTGVTIPTVTALTNPVSVYGNVTVGGYSSGYDPASMILKTPGQKIATDTNGNVYLVGSPKRNTAIAGFSFYMVLSDHVTPATGKAIVSARMLDGGGFYATTNTATEIGNGFYSISLSAADMNGQFILLQFSASGCDTAIYDIFTTP